jgi:hypothetical protein
MSVDGFPTLIKLVWAGTLDPGGNEIFSYHRWASIIAPEDLEAVMDSAANDVTNLLAESTTGSTPFSTIGQIFPESVSWESLKGYIWDEAANVNLSAEPAFRALTDAGTSAAQRLTNQDALAITTQTAASLGGRVSNRFYLPTMVTGVLEDDGHVTGSLIDDIQTQLDLDQTAHSTDDPAWVYCVYSTTNHTAQGLARYHTGDVMDTIRRRRNKLIETRHNLGT